MDAQSFLAIVEQVAGDLAEDATRATLQTLGERIDREEARQLAAQLPPEIAPWLATTTPAARFDADEFVRRVAERAGVDATTADRYARAVFDALARAVQPGEWDDMVAQLPRSFARLLPRGSHVEVMDADAFLGRVAEETGLDPDGARRATEAVLEALAQRIAGGEVDDLIERLPIELHEPLRRGRDAVDGGPRRIGLDRFLHMVAEREGVDGLEAAEHVRAVALALREAVGQEFVDVVAQLPTEYTRVLLGRGV
jgi:uncharacterized protein (DUF2267 family)